MCTATTYKTKDFYFGRTLDYEFSYFEEVTVTPRNYPIITRNAEKLTNHYAMIGMAFVQDIPLYYDAVNEKGLCMAGLNFVGNAFYNDVKPDKTNVAQFEFIPYILGKCATVDEALKLLENINLTNVPYSDKLPVAQLHWIIADKTKAITVEAVKEGLKIYDNPAGVLTNNPPFDEQMFNLNNYMGLSPRQPENMFSDKLQLKAYSRGMGALGLPGDLSSQSRFVRVAFTKLNSVSGDSEEQSVNQFFHILGSVEQQRGCCIVGESEYEITIYTSCCNADKGLYYYTTYENHAITAVDMHGENLDGDKLARYPLDRREKINYVNK
ncbi:MAG: choloylglycine hydrolase family protein [Clostridia bacterium]|nr:choloylglycine hydrolase family protein [Clostridia bacterium]